MRRIAILVILLAGCVSRPNSSVDVGGPVDRIDSDAWSGAIAAKVAADVRTTIDAKADLDARVDAIVASTIRLQADVAAFSAKLDQRAGRDINNPWIAVAGIFAVPITIGLTILAYATMHRWKSLRNLLDTLKGKPQA